MRFEARDHTWRDTWRDQPRRKNIRNQLDVAKMMKKAHETRLHRVRDARRMNTSNLVKEAMKGKVEGRRTKGRPRKRWTDNMTKDMGDLRLRERESRHWPCPEGTGTREEKEDVEKWIMRPAMERGSPKIVGSIKLVSAMYTYVRMLLKYYRNTFRDIM